MRTSHGRLGPMAGVLSSVCLVVGFFIAGSPPKADDSTAQISAFLVDKRDSILTGNVLIGLGGLFLIAFAASMASHVTASIRETDHGLGGLIIASAATGVALIVAGVAVLNGIAFKSAGDAGVVRFAWDTANGLLVTAGFAFGAFFAAVALANARSHAFPSWMTTLAALTAVLQVASCAALFAKSGFFATGGAFGFIAPLVATVWVLAASAEMYRHHAPEPTRAPAGGTASPAN